MLSSEEGFETGLNRNTNFIEFGKSFDNNSTETNELLLLFEHQLVETYSSRGASDGVRV